MVQLELDPRYLYPERFSEIDSARSQILRMGTHWGRLKPVSFDSALSTVYEKALTYFGDNPFTKDSNLDLLASNSLKQTLPFLAGEAGHFKSLANFRDRGFFWTILKYAALNQHRGRLIIPRKYEEIDYSSSKKIRLGHREGFQPTLFRLKRESTEDDERAVRRLLADLQNPVKILRPDEDEFPIYRRRALELWYQHGFRSADVVSVLAFEGLGKFDNSAVRVWAKRYRDSQRELNSVA